MKTYKSFEEWGKDWTPSKLKLYNEKMKEKYNGDDPNLLVSDSELNEITGKVIISIPLKKKN